MKISWFELEGYRAAGQTDECKRAFSCVLHAFIFSINLNQKQNFPNVSQIKEENGNKLIN